MSDVFIGLEEAAAFEGLDYFTLQKRVKRNPKQFKTKTQPREGGGKDQVMISVSSLSTKGRKAWKAAQKVDGRDVIIDKRTDAAPWYVGADLNFFIEGDGGKRKKAYYEAVELAARVQDFASMKAQIAQRGVDLVVDYEHQTLTGEQAPAAGWVKELFLDDGQIKARVEWTDRAREYLSNKEYRYLSPVITVRKSDNKAMGLHSIALTNTPAIEHMEAIVNSLTFEGGQNTMEFLKELAKLLGLGEDATEEQIMEALKSCLAENKSLKENAEAGKQPPAEDDKVVANKEVCELLGLKAGAATADVAAAIMALKGGIVGGVNLAEQVKSLEAKLADRDAEEAVEMALKAGKITPAQRDWAKNYALKNLEDFRGFVEKAPQVVPMGNVGGSETLALKSGEPDEATLLVCKQLGISAEDVKKYGMKEE